MEDIYEFNPIGRGYERIGANKGGIIWGEILG